MSLFKSTAKLGIGAFIFLAGYSFCRYANNDSRYSILRRNGQPYLYDALRKEEQPINQDNFDVGTLATRLESILKDKQLPELLDHLTK